MDPTRWLLIVAVLLSGCSREQSGSTASGAGHASSSSATHVLTGCLIGDTAVYSDIRIDTAETGDASGVQITLRRTGARWQGQTAEAAGELGSGVPIARVVLTPPDSIILDMPQELGAPDTSHFRGRISCDSLWGQQLIYRESPPSRAMYRRVR